MYQESDMDFSMGRRTHLFNSFFKQRYFPNDGALIQLQQQQNILQSTT